MRNLYQFTGGRGEVIDTPQLYSTKSRKLEDLVNNVDIARARGLFNSKMKTKIKQFLINLYCSYGYKPKQELSEKEITSFTETLGATLNDSRTISAYNTIATRYGMFSEWHFRHHVTDISFNAKKDRALTLSLISYMDTELGSFPFSSHVRTLGESVNEAAKHPFHYKKRKNLKDRLPDFILEIYKKKNSRCFDKLLMSQINFDDYADIIQVNRLCRYPSVYNSVLERLYSIEILRRKFGFKF